MAPNRGNRLPSIVLLAALLCSCSTSKTVFPPTGTLGLNVVDSGLGSQNAVTRANQIARWTLLSASAEVEGYGSYGFLGIVPCTYTIRASSGTTLGTSCGGSNLVLGAATEVGATVHLEIASMEVRRAYRPALLPSADDDGDGVANGVDNCPLVPNPDQAVYSPSIPSGAACTEYNVFTGGVTIDTDDDGVSDGLDNCTWVPNAAQADAELDGIGDACAQVARVVLAAQPFRLDLPTIRFTPDPFSTQTLTVDFDDRKTLYGCDPSFTRCYLDPSAVTVSVR